MIWLISVQKLSSYSSSFSSRAAPIFPITIRQSGMSALREEPIRFVESLCSFANFFYCFAFQAGSKGGYSAFRQLLRSQQQLLQRCCAYLGHCTHYTRCLPRWRMPLLPREPLLVERVYNCNKKPIYALWLLKFCYILHIYGKCYVFHEACSKK